MVRLTLMENQRVQVAAGDCNGGGDANPLSARIIQLKVTLANCADASPREYVGALQIGGDVASLNLLHRSQGPQGFLLRHTVAATVRPARRARGG